MTERHEEIKAWEQRAGELCDEMEGDHRILDAEMSEEDTVLEALKGWLASGVINQEAFDNRAWAYKNRKAPDQ